MPTGHGFRTAFRMASAMACMPRSPGWAGHAFVFVGAFGPGVVGLGFVEGADIHEGAADGFTRLGGGIGPRRRSARRNCGR